MQKILIILCFLCLGISEAQNKSLAENYAEQGEYAKALVIYKELYQQNPNSQTFLVDLVDTYKNLDSIHQAEDVLVEFLKRPGDYPHIEVELGYLYQQDQQLKKAESLYNSAISKVEIRPVYAYAIGKAFQKYGLLSYAQQTYEKAQELRPSTNFLIQLAQIYGEQSKFDQMFEMYVDLIEKNERYFKMLNQIFNEFITEDPQNEANLALKKTLLKRNQEEPKLIYNETLSWLFTQQKDYNMAFIQEKAIYARSEEKNAKRLFDLAKIVFEEEDFSLAEKIFLEVQDKTNYQSLFYESAQHLLLILEKREDIKKIEVEEAYQTFFDNEDVNEYTSPILLNWARFKAFQNNDKTAALQLLDDAADAEIRKTQEAELKTLKADILLKDEQFNQALLLYAQVERLVPNSDLSRESKFKTAQASYFKGDFKWALSQLDVLKNSVSELIANDAMELALHIKDNAYQDSTQTDLKKVAKADFLKFQNKNTEAIQVLEQVLEDYKTEEIIDKTLYRLAQIHNENQDLEQASTYYQKLIDDHPESILADNANFELGLIYMNKLNQPKKAQTYFESIIFNYSDSIFFVAARRYFRELRGDKIKENADI
ncbi:tetratricopeptide repeat protein [Psychroflexus halocasei]|uniref:Tetratricopeptide repeat-containing protein n=1 Tax=Psychroflexus halocasei TaxID=908615 RepID=A0A1H4CNR0_9FLAO|nr:tetratricopeptide repeat protein [Psychroflexus halocasei]SEA61970.1 Tetratricopeptide repeat-containing protein [Psychroflexus halocasei]